MPRKAASADKPSSSAKSRFITNHALVLLLISSHPKILQRTIAEQLKLTERAVQRIIVELEKDGYLTREKLGRNNVYKLSLKLSLPDQLCQHVKLGNLIQLLQK